MDILFKAVLTFWNLFIIVPPIFADILPPGTRYMERCVMIVNLEDFPDIVLLAHSTWPPNQTHVAYFIQNGECLKKGYKFSKFRIYVTPFVRAKTINLQQMPPSDLTLLADDIEPYAGGIDERNALTKEVLEYSLSKAANGRFTLYKSKQILSYSERDSEPDHEKQFPLPFPTPSLSNKTPPAQSSNNGRDFFVALFLSIIIEVPIIYALVVRYVRDSKLKTSQILLVGSLATVATLPYLWFVLPIFVPDRLWLAVLGEGFVIAGETVLYWQLLEAPVGLATVISLVANGLSFIVGELNLGG